MHLSDVPQEVLEDIAFHAATADFVGPPAGVLGLLGTNTRIHSALSVSSNHHIWAAIFQAKFDIPAPLRRLAKLSPATIVDELKKRCILLRRIRTRDDCLVQSHSLDDFFHHDIKTVLWTAYFMMIENEGKNEAQLREYAQMDLWLKDFLFDPLGASRMRHSAQMDSWPSCTEASNAIAMWLFWMLLEPDNYLVSDPKFHEVVDILKIIALGAHEYTLCFPSWKDFRPDYRLKDVTHTLEHFGQTVWIMFPSIAPPAILAYLTLVNKMPVSLDSASYRKAAMPTLPTASPVRDSREWETDWERGLQLALHSDKPFISELSGAFVPGSLQGVWEGVFTYTEFTSYAALLSGASPGTLQRSHVAQHPHLWKVREYHFYANEEDPRSKIPSNNPLSSGNPLRGYLPDGVEIREVPEGIEFTERGRAAPVLYHKYTPENRSRKVEDVFVAGEGHSSWGQFEIFGRVRPSDGLISLSKEYVDSGRGRWLYRAFMVGNSYGNLSGRWRDTLSPPDTLGYEGCFVMSRRR